MKTCGCLLGPNWKPDEGIRVISKELLLSYAQLLEEEVVRLRKDNAAMLKLIEECSESVYARVACLEFLRTRSKTKKKNHEPY